MTGVRLFVVVVLVAVIGVFGYDGVRVLNAHRDVRNAASDAASAGAHAIAKTHQEARGAAAASAAARADGDVMTSFHYDPVLAEVTVKVSGGTDTLVLHYFDSHLSQDITATATARPS